MHVVGALAPSRKSLALSALLFAIPLALAQIVLVFLSVWAQAYTPWLVGTAACSLLGGGFCALRTTRKVSDETISINYGRFSGLLTGLLSSLLGLFLFALLLVWYTNWWIPRLSSQRPPGCVPQATLLSCMSPQAVAKFGLAFLPLAIMFFLLGNVGFVLLALLGGTLVAHLRARHISMKQR